jgi:hypothetical protein
VVLLEIVKAVDKEIVTLHSENKFQIVIMILHLIYSSCTLKSLYKAENCL